MSGFVVSRNPDADQRNVARRGPDETRTVEVEGYFFTHHLARVSDDRRAQPLVDGDIVCVYDGEIYDHPLAGRADSSGGEAREDLIALYRQYGDDFARHLDGEFAIALYDFGRRHIVLATDPFATKPMFVQGTEVASYPSALVGAPQAPPNTVQILDLDGWRGTWRIVEPFDFDHQHKDTYDDWIAAFERAVAKRALDGCYLPLSAGYDSGCIDCALRRLGTSFKAFSIEGVENLDLLRQRNPDGDILRMDEASVAEWIATLRDRCEPATYRGTDFRGLYREFDMLEDKAPPGLALIHSLASAEGRRVFLSGQGADELAAACRHWPGNRFPERLSKWPDFDRNFQRAYLTKEEFIGGAYGCEGRYPFLDRAVVQEFLWLSVELKNRHYKAPFHEYMARWEYPFEEQVKTGFLPIPL